MNKKFVSLLVAGALITSLGTTSAFAASTKTPLCSVSSCTQTGAHRHDGKTYAAHSAGDGHSYHSNCGVSDCTKTGSHQHNGSHGGGHGNGGHRSGRHHG